MADVKPYHDGRVHVCAQMCETCIFRPGNLMGLRPGRVREMVAEATQDESAITCHSTLYRGDDVQQAVCRGFFDRHRTSTLQIADRLGLVTFIEPKGDTP